MRNYAASLGLAVLGTISVSVMRSKVAASLISQGVPSAQANAAASSLSQSRSGNIASIPHFIRVDFAEATQVILYILAGVMAVAAIVALVGLRAGVQEEAAGPATAAEPEPSTDSAADRQS